MVKIGLMGLNALEQSAICAWGEAACANVVWAALAPEAATQSIDALLCSQQAHQRHGPWPEDLPVAVLHNGPVINGGNQQANGGRAVVVIDTGHGQPLAEAALKHWLTNTITQLRRPAYSQATQASLAARPSRDRQHFSRREAEVLDLLSQGLSNDQISASLNIRTATVKTYLRRIFERTGAVNRTHAVSLYRQARLD